LKPITKSVFRKLFRMKLRLIGISLVISMAMAMFVAGFYGADVMDHSISNLLEKNKMPDIFVEFSTPAEEADVDLALSNSPDIEAYDLRLKMSGVYNHNGEVFLAVFVGIKDPNNQDINKLDVEDGKLFSSSGEAVAIAGMESQGVKKGALANFEISGEGLNLEITGTVRSAEYIFNSAYTDYSIPFTGSLVVIYMPIDDLQEYSESEINDVIILLKEDGSGKDAVDLLDGFEIDSVTYQESHPSVTFMNIGTGKLKSMFPLIAIIFMFIGFISIFMTMMRLVQNDSRYIGVLMSLGYTRVKIVKTYLLLGLAICVIGCLFGILISIGMTISFVEVGMSLYMSVEDIILPFIPLPFILGILFTSTVVMFSVWVPVRYITGSSVREALEYKPRGKVHTLKMKSSRISKITMLGIRNTTRNPTRLLITVLVVGLTIGVAGSWLVMADSALEYMSDQIEADRWDLRADFLTPVPVESVNTSFLGMEQDDAEYIITFSYLNAEIISGQKNQGAIIIGCDEMERARDFQLKEGKLNFNKAVITTKIQDELGVGVGDNIKILFGTKEINIEVSGIVYDIMALTMYTSKANIDLFTPQYSCSGAFIKLTKPEDAKEIAKTMRNIPAVSKVVVHTDISATIDELMEMAESFLYGFFFLNIIITIVVAGSAVIISTMERDVEFATLDTLGISKRLVAKSILIEIAILAVMSSAVGIPFAYIFGKLIAVVLESVVFYFPVIFALGASITIFLMGIIFVLISSIVPIRYSRKLNTETTIRERTAG